MNTVVGTTFLLVGCGFFLTSIARWLSFMFAPYDSDGWWKLVTWSRHHMERTDVPFAFALGVIFIFASLCVLGIILLPPC